MNIDNIRALDYADKVSHCQYRHLETHGKGRKKYYYAISGKDVGNGLSHVSMIMKTGSTYDGTVNINNERHGWGVYQVVFAGRYEGEWQNGFKHGTGVSYYKNKRVQYDGEWIGGEPHGQGKAYNFDGKLVYDGMWKGGKSSQGIFMERYKTRI